jgi:hypothetical protein
MRFMLVALTVCCLVLVAAGSAGASVRRVAFAGIVQQGHRASLTVSVSPRARCTITVLDGTTVVRARGLGAKTGTWLNWWWNVGSNARLGRWPVTVNCGRAGRLTLRLRVTA